MASIVLIGADTALLEGLAQTLGGCGHRAVLAPTVADAIDAAVAARPLVVVVDRSLATRGSGLLRVRLAPGGKFVLYHTDGETAPALPASLQRAAMADLTLPLERHRLVTLVQHVEDRARRAGRTEVPTPPEHRAI